MDKIFIEDLQIDTVIGIYDWEREIRQVISLDIEMQADITAAAASDAVVDTINYKKVAKRLIQYVSSSQFQLIETLIERVADIILYEFGVSQVWVRLCKPGAVRYSKNVGIEISRQRQAVEQHDVYISIGSNTQPETHIRSALAMLGNEFPGMQSSDVYQNAAVGFAGQDFLNLAVAIQTCLPLVAILRRLRQIEDMHGRDRAQPKFSARTLDLDLLLYGEQVIEQEGLSLPRKDITRYAFVLKPLAELAPDFRHPLEHKTLAALWDAFTGERSMQVVDITA